MKISDAAINDALIREILTGHKLKATLERERERATAQHAKELGKRNAGVLGKCVASIPAWEFFQLRQKYGEEEISSREFIRDYQKRYPHLSPNKA